MKTFRLVLIISILTLIGLVWYLVASNTAEEPLTPPSLATDFESIVPIETSEDEVQGSLSFVEQNTDVYQYIPQTGTTAYNQFINLVADDRFILFSCELPNRSGSVGLMLVEAPSDALIVPEISPILRVASQWEPFILQDIGQVLFPNLPGVENTLLTDFTDYELLLFVDGHTATFVIDGSQYELHYAWNLSYIFFASSKDCLELMAESIYSPYTH